MNEQDYKNYTVEEVLEAVHNGEITAEEALALENKGKARKTLVEALEELNNASQTSDGDTPEVEQVKVPVKLIANIKLGSGLFKAGDKLEVDEDVYEALVKVKAVEES